MSAQHRLCECLLPPSQLAEQPTRLVESILLPGGRPIAVEVSAEELATFSNKTVHEERNRYRGSFALAIRSIPRLPEGQPTALWAGLGAEPSLCSSLWRRDWVDRCTLELGLLSATGRAGAAAVGLTMQGHATGSTSAEALALASDLARELWQVLATVAPAYEFEPLDQMSLAHALRPFVPGHQVEIVRREGHFRLHSMQPAGRPLGFATRNDGIAPDAYAAGSASCAEEEETVHFIHPYLPPDRPADGLLQLLARQPEPTLVSLQLGPTVLGSDEEQYLYRMLALCEQPSGKGVELEAEVLRHCLYAQLCELRGSCFTLRVHIASSAPVGAAVSAAVGQSLTRGPTLLEEGTFLGGGYCALDRATTGAGAAPAPCGPPQRLLYLVGADQAAGAFCLPVAIGPSPGLKTRLPLLLARSTDLPAQGLPLGTTCQQGEQRLVYIPHEHRTRHQYIVGQTGTGKSTLLLNQALADLRDGLPLILIDPHGDLASQVLAHMPASRVGDTILFDASDWDYPVGFNILEAGSEMERQQAIEELIGLIYLLYDPNRTGIFGPRGEHNLRACLMTAASNKARDGNTLLEGLGYLMNPGAAIGEAERIKDPLIRSYWTRQINRTGGFTSEPGVLDYFVSKISRFCTCPPIRRIVGQCRSSLRISDVMEQRKVLIVKLSRGTLGPENSNFLGILLLSKTLLAVLGRSALPEEQRHLVSLVVDEAHLFSSPLLSYFLSEGRKYGVSITLANQHLGQLSAGVRESVLGNAGCIVCFRVGAEDAEVAAAVLPGVPPRAVMELPSYRALVRLQLGAAGTSVVQVDTAPPPPEPRTSVAEQIRAESRRLYGRRRASVDRDIARRWRRWTE